MCVTLNRRRHWTRNLYTSSKKYVPKLLLSMYHKFKAYSGFDEGDVIRLQWKRLITARYSWNTADNDRQTMRTIDHCHTEELFMHVNYSSSKITGQRAWSLTLISSCTETIEWVTEQKLVITARTWLYFELAHNNVTFHPHHQLSYGLISWFSMLQPYSIQIGCDSAGKWTPTRGGGRGWCCDRTSMSSCRRSKLGMEFCMLLRIPRLMFSTHGSSSSSGQMCSILPSSQANLHDVNNHIVNQRAATLEKWYDDS